ncbi:MAG: hypothetical protein ACHQ1E_07380, partial [Ktedonobacterales bacterium]
MARSSDHPAHPEGAQNEQEREQQREQQQARKRGLYAVPPHTPQPATTDLAGLAAASEAPQPPTSDTPRHR